MRNTYSTKHKTPIYLITPTPQGRHLSVAAPARSGGHGDVDLRELGPFASMLLQKARVGGIVVVFMHVHNQSVRVVVESLLGAVAMMLQTTIFFPSPLFKHGLLQYIFPHTCFLPELNTSNESLYHVIVEDGHSLDPVSLAGVLGADGDVIENTESHPCAGQRVVSRRTHHHVGVFHFSRHHCIQGSQTP